MRKLTSHDYAELLALSRLERIGYERSDLYARCATLAEGVEFAYEPPPEPDDEELFDNFSALVTTAGVHVDDSASANRRQGAEQETSRPEVDESQAGGS
ncbi:MAG: hypothetical protein Aurels2KO_10320 [Aureliella sp.]